MLADGHNKELIEIYLWRRVLLYQNRTPLLLACASGYINIVCLLIKNPCKINVQDSENGTPLMKVDYIFLLKWNVFEYLS